MKKITFFIFIFTMMCTLLPSHEVVKAKNENTINDASIIKEDNNKIKSQVTKETSENIFIESSLVNNNTNITAYIKLNKSTDKMDVSVVTSNDHSIEEKNFTVKSYKIEKDILKATLIDKKTNKVYNIDPTEFQASRAGAMRILGDLIKNGRKATNKKHGKKNVKKAIESKKYNKLLASVKSLDKRKNHIYTVKHAWHLIGVKHDWGTVKKVINLTMRWGTDAPYGKAFIKQKTLKINGQTVVVTYNPYVSKNSISNAWVKTK
ncbi:SAR2788 family putative toxin [Bacillus swezeyi]|uniref:SAR2788 family putative toxin n=1 Tax=Bacillus swezeyi TaxID=1925020 RepID=UPI002E1D923A|nr:SAR2788 family putative toxin [Bacillus swezeyi]